MKTILDPVRHDRLIANLDNYCETANVQRRFVEHSMKDFVPADADEVEWVTHFNHYRTEGTAGLLFVGQFDNPTVDVRMMAIAGALLRNYLDARIVPLNTLLEIADSGGEVDATILLIPNLFIVGAAGKTLPAWKMQGLYDILMKRMTTGKPTVAYVENMADLTVQYGVAMATHLKTHFKIIGG